MRVSGWKSAATGALGILTIGVVLSAAPKLPRLHVEQARPAAPAATGDIALVLDPANSKVRWSVDSTLHLVHGTFAVKAGALRFEAGSGKASGEIVVSAASGESGNSSRDEKMRKEVLERGKYPEAAFRPTLFEGTIAATGPSDLKLHGALLLHGVSHDLVVPVHVEMGEAAWKGSAKFEVPYIAWGLSNPSNFLLKVQPVVNVELEFSGSRRN